MSDDKNNMNDVPFSPCTAIYLTLLKCFTIINIRPCNLLTRPDMLHLCLDYRDEHLRQSDVGTSSGLGSLWSVFQFLCLSSRREILNII